MIFNIESFLYGLAKKKERPVSARTDFSTHWKKI
jgi:hypothetical protein